MMSKKYWIPLLGIITICGASYGFNKYIDHQNELAQNEIFSAIYRFENNEYDLAIDGNDTENGFKTIISKYRFTKTSNLAHLYLGICYINKRQYSDAITYLKKFKTKEKILLAKSLALQGDAYVELENYSAAIDAFEKAAKICDTDEAYSPLYAYKAALTYEELGKMDEALKCLKQIIQKFPNSYLCTEIAKEIRKINNANTK